MRRLLLFIVALAVAATPNPVYTGAAGALVNRNSDPPVVAPEQVGMDGNRLRSIRTVMNRHVTEQRIPGAMALVARRGKIAYQEAFGMADVEAGKPMKLDTIHRIYSMSKPITSVAVMMLYEDGKFQLNDPVAKYLPEFGKLVVGIEEKDPQTGQPALKRVPLRRPVTVRDLLRHTAGLSYGFFGDSLVDREYRKAKILSDLNLVEFITNLSQIPLQFEPGARWHYSVSVDVLGRLVEVLSGKSFDKFLEERIFVPLNMRDTAFFVPSEKKVRFAKLYSPTKDGKIQATRICATRSECVEKFPEAVPSYFEPPTLLSGGGGLVSTAHDYLRFCQMLLNGGRHEGKMLISRKTIQLMTSDNLGSIPISSPGYGFGLGFAVSKAPGEAGIMGSPGEFNWGGAAGTRFWIDPKEELVGIFMIQILPHTGLEYGSEFRVLTYQAIAD